MDTWVRRLLCQMHSSPAPKKTGICSGRCLLSFTSTAGPQSYSCWTPVPLNFCYPQFCPKMDVMVEIVWEENSILKCCRDFSTSFVSLLHAECRKYDFFKGFLVRDFTVSSIELWCQSEVPWESCHRHANKMHLVIQQLHGENEEATI